MRDRFWRLVLSFSASGLVLGTLFFAASLTPSLLPRTYVTPLSGVAMACGYGLGVLLAALWFWLELPEAKDRVRLLDHGSCRRRLRHRGARLPVAHGRMAELHPHAGMHLPPIESAHPFYVGLIALAVFLVLFGLGRLFAFSARPLPAPLQARGAAAAFLGHRHPSARNAVLDAGGWPSRVSCCTRPIPPAALTR